VSLDTPNGYTAWLHAVRRTVAWEGDGTESSVALTAQTTGYAFIVNGKSDGSARGDAGTQVMSGLLGAIVNPRVRTSLVIGLGTGSTAGWLGAIPAMERVDVVELEPLILKVARDCSPVNRDVLDNPKVHIQIADAREVLLTTRNRYDLIASEPSNPFRAGIASLFTREYYAAAIDRLTPDGLFVQWVQSYEIDAATFKTILATFASIFPHVEVWQTRPGDLMLVGGRHPLTYRAATLAARIEEEPFKTALHDAWRAIDVEGLLAHFVANGATVRALLAQPGIVVNTDDRNVVEFGLARSAGFQISPYAALRAFALANRGWRPAIDEASIDWDRVQSEWVNLHAPDDVFTGVTAQGPPAHKARQAAVILYYRDHNLTGALTDWRQQSEPPRGPIELAMMADTLAEMGLEEALLYIEPLRAYQPVEADAALATLYMRQRKDEEEAAVLESATKRLRTDPWPLFRFTSKIIALAQQLGMRNPALAPRMLEALKPPFAVLAAQDQRLTAAAFLTRLVDFRQTCRDAVGALEPHVPWTADFLLLRHDCYAAVGHPRASAAAADLQAFAEREPVPLVRPVPPEHRQVSR